MTNFSQVTLFYRSLTPVEQDHVVAAYTFELSKCYEQTIRERQLIALANIDADLGERVAQGLGLPAPKPTEEATDPEPSAALSQLGETWPVTGRVVGLIIGADSSQAHIAAMLEAMQAADVVSLVVAPAGGTYGSLTAQRTYANASSTEFDALVVISATPPAPDAVPALDTKSGAGHGPAAPSDTRAS